MDRMKDSDSSQYTEPVVTPIDDSTILLCGVIDETSCGNFLNLFFQMDQRDHDRIVLKLISNGGSEDCGFAIYDAIRSSRNKVRVEAYGYAQSIATLIFMAGDERAMAPECRFMVHQGSVTLGDVDFRTMRTRAREWGLLDQRYNEIMAERSGMTLGDVEVLVQDETYLSSRDCINYGIATEIIKTR